MQIQLRNFRHHVGQCGRIQPYSLRKALESLGPDIWNRTLYANLTTSECLETYNAQFISGYGSGWGLITTFSYPDVNPWSGNTSGFGEFDLKNIYSCKIYFLQHQPVNVLVRNCLVGQGFGVANQSKIASARLLSRNVKYN